MPKHRFTVRWIESVTPPDNGQADYFDTNRIGRGRSFGLRVSAAGSKSWFVMYRNGGKLKRLTFGTYPELGLADAREAADRQVKAIIEGRDPAQEKQDEKHAMTVRALAGEYLERHAKRHKQSWQQDQRILRRDILPNWGDRKAKDIKRRDVIAVLETIVARGAGIQANRTLEVVRKMYNWAIETDLLEYNPCYQVKKPIKAQARDRVLSEEEIRAFWHGLDKSSIRPPIQLALKLILVTAQRKGEIIGAKKSEFDLDTNWWTIPADRTKNRLSHRVPLSSQAIEILKQTQAFSGSSPFLFPARRPNEATRDFLVNRAVHRNLEIFGIDHFTPHDLRRTAASHMTSIRIPR
ncbi:MAG: tyrosine-type recombinase/integrase, partial [Gammaproteobacteria bacterium]